MVLLESHETCRASMSHCPLENKEQRWFCSLDGDFSPLPISTMNSSWCIDTCTSLSLDHLGYFYSLIGIAKSHSYRYANSYLEHEPYSMAVSQILASSSFMQKNMGYMHLIRLYLCCSEGEVEARLTIISELFQVMDQFWVFYQVLRLIKFCFEDQASLAS